MRYGIFFIFVMSAAILSAIFFTPQPSLAAPPGQGGLTIIEPDGKSTGACPLEHTSVKAEISGFLGRVSVTQIFKNPMDKKIEAVYTFPLSADAAVDDMVMRVGDRVVRGEIKRREEARRIYERARDRGHVASLLDQERPNIFTQSVANIMPGEKVEITIKYVEVLPFVDGSFNFVFPTVVGPRFIPGEPTGSSGTGWAPDTTQVPDASRITPPVTPKGTRAGHDIDISVSIDAGVPILGIESKLHEVETKPKGQTQAEVSLKNKKEIPNKDFVLTYLVAGDQVRSGFLTNKDGNTGHVMVIMIPPKRVKPEQIAPKEMIFVIDCSGSQRGKPLEKAKEAMRYALEHMNPDDTFNVIDFNVGTRMLFSEPKKNTPEMRAKALQYLESLEARGGTWMGPAIETVCKTPPPENRLRIVMFMTDGYVGNDFEIIGLVKNLRGKSRWFPFGAGSSLNRFLIDNMARVGGGEAAYIMLNSPGDKEARRFYERISTPVLTDISVSTEGVTLDEVYPKEVADLWDQKPLIFKARYTSPRKGKITIKGQRGKTPYEQTLNVNLPEKETKNSALGSLWARAKVDDLMDQDLFGMQRRAPKEETKEAIIKVALDYRIMTQFTSFVAVEEATVTVEGKPVKVTVPVEMPEGVSREGVFGEQAAVLGQMYPGAPAKMLMTRRAGGPPSAAPMASAPAKEAYKREAPGEARVPSGGFGRTQQPRDMSSRIEEDKRQTVASRDDEATRVASLASKLVPDLQEVLKRKVKTGDYTVGKLTIKDGKLTVKVWLNDTKDSTVKKLEEAGLKISFKAAGGKVVIGVLEVDKLEALAKIPEVRLIEPVQVG